MEFGVVRPEIWHADDRVAAQRRTALQLKGVGGGGGCLFGDYDWGGWSS